MIISEKNILDHFNKLNHLPLIDIFKDIYKNIDFNNYNSIQSNFISLFIYYSVLKEKPLIEFKEVIDYIYSNEILLKNMNFHRFFKESSNMSWKGYFLNSELNKNIWDDLSFLFFNVNYKNNIILNKKRFDYLKIIFNSISNNGKILNYFYDAQPINLFHRISNEKDYLKMFQLIYKNSNLHISKKNEFNSLPISILESISYYNDKYKQNIYSKFIINKFKLFESTFFDNLIKFENDESNNLSLKTNVYLFYYFDNFNTDKILNFIISSLQNQILNKSNEEKSDICFQFHNSFLSSKNDFFTLPKINPDTININLDFYSNFLTISMFLSEFKNNNFNSSISKNLISYLEKFNSFLELPENRSLKFILDYNLKIEPSKIINYLILHQESSSNHVKQKTLKI